MPVVPFLQIGQLSGVHKTEKTGHTLHYRVAEPAEMAMHVQNIKQDPAHSPSCNFSNPAMQ